MLLPEVIAKLQEIMADFLNMIDTYETISDSLNDVLKIRSKQDYTIEDERRILSLAYQRLEIEIETNEHILKDLSDFSQSVKFTYEYSQVSGLLRDIENGFEYKLRTQKETLKLLNFKNSLSKNLDNLCLSIRQHIEETLDLHTLWNTVFLVSFTYFLTYFIL